MILPITPAYFEQFWPTFQKTVELQQTFAFDCALDKQGAYNIWVKNSLECYVYIEHDEVLGSYYLKPNAMGPGNHIGNCGYMVTERARGRGIAKAFVNIPNSGQYNSGLKPSSLIP
ncbi:GNAT family N-acetyltransferase [Vibrio sonorensis]|uniref:GNAT family N-acetyltransferase n=1 Tax=Vibrio sonorensis TaxID=1004316 RepID=UPI001FE1D3A2|nr:GNAT family N-acetyltransferase [Vibrio sonorensis]